MNKPYFLYADSNIEDKDCLEKMLYEFKPLQKFFFVNNGFELIEFLQKVRKGDAYPSVIIMGESMHRLDGLSTLELLKSDDIYCLIPVIILGSAKAVKDPQVYHHLGADVITKASDLPGWKKVAEEICEYNH